MVKFLIGILTKVAVDVDEGAARNERRKIPSKMFTVETSKVE